MKRLNINSMANSSRVYKKTCSNGKLAIYLGKRDFVDHVDMVDPIDGVVLVDPDYLKGRKLFVMLTCAFRYGHDDLDVIGLTFRKDLYVQVQQVFPPEPTSTQGPLTVLQERLLQKLGDNAYPFTLQMVVNLPCSVTLQPGPEDAGKVHYHGKPISVNVSINNCTNKVIKKIKISVDQITDVVLYSLDKYTKTVFIQEFTETIAANSNFSKSFAVTPLLAANCQKQGLALDGKLKHGDTNLASSTILHSSLQPGMNKELLGILVSYKVRVNLMVSGGGILGDLITSDVGVELPLILMHPKPSHEGASSEDIVIEEFARQEHRGEESQEALAAEGDEGS
ncbi:arrestin-C isoform X14 [Herpailurus yagouaroundi]|uniref:arrestin-C isoform X14 n=1 Tax=Herpailurus yagouaroundi TaxID=1608482 RepID=UPI001AD60AA8|nr:arrestin-C isoform X14 [Puma yagouaroundi]